MTTAPKIPPVPDTPIPSVRDRVLSSGVSEERLTAHHEAKRVLLDGATVVDLDTPAPEGTRINIGPS